MAWRIELTASALKQLKKLDRSQAKRITDYLHNRVSESPRRVGKALQGSMSALWRYRVGDYRVVCELQDEQVLVLVLRVSHRRDVYR
ncbi:MAG: type II toxin-antitoxin system RelE/ParE family toxin [Halothiobacillus sp.]|nr:type II toxin-antitoxin system RelE/ParE family toxin [Halothiobacillus sp.]